jgi:hypothetical protein
MYTVRKRTWFFYLSILPNGGFWSNFGPCKWRRFFLLNNILLFFFFSGSAAQRGLWPLRSRGFLITHNDAPQSVGLLWTSDQLVAETSTRQHTTYTADKHSCPRWDSNPRSQQASDRAATGTGKQSLIQIRNKREILLIFLRINSWIVRKGRREAVKHNHTFTVSYLSASCFGFS